jgi:hypothetical protein
MQVNYFGFPTFPITTPLGQAYLTVQDNDSCYITSHPVDGIDEGLTINGVVYCVSLRCQYVNGEWTYSQYENGRADFSSLYMSRLKWDKVNEMDATPAARKKAGVVLFQIVNDFFADNPDVPRQARVVRLTNDLRAQQQKVKEAILLQEEAQRQIDATRAELAGLLDDEGKKAAYNAERNDLIKETEQRSLRDAALTERELELNDLLSQVEGRRGACARYLTRQHILLLADHIQGQGDDLGGYLLTTKFRPTNGLCYEVPVTADEAREIDRAQELLGIGP